MEKRLLQVLQTFYGAAGDATAWNGALAEFAQLMDTPTASITLFDRRHHHYNLNASLGVPPDAARAYESHFASIDPWFLRAMGQVSAGWVGTGEQLCPLPELRRTEFYSDFLVPNDWLHECAAVVESRDSAVSALTMLRHPSQRPFGAQQLRLLRLMVPHVQKALVLHRRIVDLHATTQVQQWAIDAAPYGVLLFADDGRLILANQRARSLCGTSSNLRLTRKGLSIARQSENARLQHAMACARLLRGSAESDAIIVTQSNGEPLVVTVSPIRLQDPLMSGATVAVFIHDPASTSLPSESLLMKLYGLTPAEARVAIAIGRGEQLCDVADRLGVTVNTIRAHAKVIFHKTKTSRQAELVRLLLSLPAPPDFKRHS